MTSILALQVSPQIKEAFEHEIAAQAVEQNDAMIRIGLEAVRMLRNVHVNSDIDALKQTYDRQLEWKDQEHEVLVKVLHQQEEEEIQRRVVHCNEQMKSLQEQTMHWKERVSELESAAASNRDNLLNAERQQYRLIDEVRQQARETQEAHHRTHQDELMKFKEHIVQLTEELKTKEAMSAIRIQQDVRNEVDHQQQEHERKYQGLQEHNNTLKHELERLKDEYKSLEKVSELSLKQVANELEVKFLHDPEHHAGKHFCRCHTPTESIAESDQERR
jgi:chromosome segregation ATPase